MIYLDYNATAPMKPAVRTAVVEAMERHGNPSSVHRYGRTARRYVEESRAAVAALVGVKAAQVIFTSGGTEANATILRAYAYTDSVRIVSAAEHDSVLASAPDSLRLPVTADGVVDLAAAEEILRAALPRSLVSVMLVNNETGVIQPVAEIARIAKTYGHITHTDAVQAAGRLPVDFTALGVQAMTLSAHKIGGPQGVGALIVDENLVIPPLLTGGGQEKNRRAGTENVAGIVGFGVAAQLTVDDLRDVPRLAAQRDGLQERLRAMGGADAVVLGANAPRVANTLCLALRGVRSETQVVAMDLAGVAVSAGAACSSGKVKTSHVARAMGYDDSVAGSVLRITLGWDTKDADIDRCVTAWQTMYQRIRATQTFSAA